MDTSPTREKTRRNALVEEQATIRRRLLRAMGSRGTTATQIPSNRLPSRLSGANLPPGLLVLESRKRLGELRFRFRTLGIHRVLPGAPVSRACLRPAQEPLADERPCMRVRVGP